MSLINCPECGHQVATSAVACPSCGHPFGHPVVQKKVIVAETPTEGGVPPWVFAVLGVLGVVLLFVLFMVIGKNEDETANRAINVDVETAARRDQVDARDRTVTTTTTTTAPSSVTTVPPATDSSAINAPATASSTGAAPSSVTTVPPSSSTSVTGAPPNKGRVTINARIATRMGSVQAVTKEKFYLLDESLESILGDADLEPISGQNLTDSFGLSVLYPERYPEFNRNALRAINDHIKYNALTDAAGKGQINDIEPNNYYLFGVTKAGKGFAVWSSPIVVVPGDNVLNLSPQRLTEVQE